MENHGPLHLEPVHDHDLDVLYTKHPPKGCDALTIYLRNLRNTDRMLGSLRRTLQDGGHPASLCWYGDHVPIMPSVYEVFGTPSGHVPYLCWSNTHNKAAPAFMQEDLSAEDLALRWLNTLNMWGTGEMKGLSTFR